MDKINCQILDEISIKGAIAVTMRKVNELVEGYNEMMKELIKLKKVVFIDAYDTMIEKINNHVKDFHKIKK